MFYIAVTNIFFIWVFQSSSEVAHGIGGVLQGLLSWKREEIVCTHSTVFDQDKIHMSNT